ncbi:MAG: DUF4433 domain-containing protein, partial [Fimbriimonadales bacterium]
RSAIAVPIEPHGVLNDYVPFYFCPRSPMLYCIDRGNVPTYQDGQGPVVHLVTDLDQLTKANVEFVFTDRHAKSGLATFYREPADLARLDWRTINSNSWGYSDDYPERRELKQAELLVYEHVPWGCIVGIGTYNIATADEVRSLLQRYGMKTRVAVKTGWYY